MTVFFVILSSVSLGGKVMVKTLRVYNADTLIAESESPVELIQLTPATKYNLECSFYENGQESTKSPVPEFTTEAQEEPPVIATSMSVLPLERTCAVGDWRNFVISFKPENTTDLGITWETDTSGLEYMPVPNDMYLRFRGIKAGTYDVVVTSTSNPELTKTVKFTVI